MSEDKSQPLPDRRADSRTSSAKTGPTICFVAANHGASWGASEFLWSDAAQKLLKHADTHVVVSVGERSINVPAVATLRKSGATVLPRRKVDDDAAFDVAEVPGAAAADVAATRPDLVVVSHGDNREGFPWMEYCAERSIRYATLAHRASENDWPDATVSKRIRDAYLGAVEAHFVSEHNLRLTERMICALLPRTAVVRNPFRVDYHRTIGWPSSTDPLRVACVARFDLESKAQDVLLDVLAQPVWRSRPIQVDLVGNDGSHALVLRDLRSFLRLDNVRIRTRVSDVRAVWRECHALLLPSRLEGLPIAIVEAMLAGRPCVATDVGGASEVIEHGRTGWLAESATTSAFARAMESAWRARTRWDAIGRRAAKRIRSLVPEDPAEVYAGLVYNLAVAI